MARREIRRMLTQPRKQAKSRPWAIPALMALVLLVGLGAGLGIGLLAGSGDAPPPAETVIDRPPRPVAEDDPAPPPLPDPQAGLLTPVPMAPVPMARPGGPADESVEPLPAIPPVRDEVELVAAVAPVPAPKAAGMPAWKAHAVPAPDPTGRPMVAVVIDDMGIDRRRSERMTRLPGPLTLSWLTYGEDLGRQTAAARQRGHELMLHVPMEPMGGRYDPGPDVLEVKLSPDEVRRRLQWGLGRFDGFVGINNHMGSRFTAHEPGMEVVMRELGRRGLLFLDSVTSEKTVGAKVAARHHIPFATRNVFLDNDQSVAAVKAQLAKLEAHARKHGAAIAIGHPYDATIEALAGWLPSLSERGFVLVPVSAIVAKGH